MLLKVTEEQNRANKAWEKFGVYKGELTSKNYPLAARFKLLTSVIQTTFLCGCYSWTLTTRKREAMIGSLQGKMLRRFEKYCWHQKGHGTEWL